MATIDQLDYSVYSDYARRTQQSEQINKEFQLNSAHAIPDQIKVLTLNPTESQLDRLLGSAYIQRPWSLFLPPENFSLQRRSTFGFFRIGPSLGSTEKEEEESEQKFDEEECATEEEANEKQKIKTCFAQMKKINRWLNFIIGRIGQFLPG